MTYKPCRQETSVDIQGDITTSYTTLAEGDVSHTVEHNINGLLLHVDVDSEGRALGIEIIM